MKKHITLIHDYSKWLIIAIFSSLIVFYSCSKGGHYGSVKEGTIKYKITYLESEKENPIIGLLPSTLKMQFSNDNVVLNINGWSNIFKSSFIKRKNNDTYTLLKIIGKKYVYQSPEGETYYGISVPENVKIEYDDNSTKILAGFECKHAVVVISDTTSFDVYYTPDIRIKNPTVNTPLDEIPGMLMAFTLEMNGIPMRLEAIEYIDEKVPESAFEIPTGYKPVERSAMDEIFNGLRK